MLSTPVLISMFCVSELLNYEENHENKAPETFGKNRKTSRERHGRLHLIVSEGAACFLVQTQSKVM